MNGLNGSRFIIKYDQTAKYVYNEEGIPFVSGRKQTRLGLAGIDNASIDVAIEIIQKSPNLFCFIFDRLRICFQKYIIRSVVELNIEDNKGQRYQVLANIKSLVHRLHLTKEKISEAQQTNALAVLLTQNMQKEYAVINSYEHFVENCRKAKAGDFIDIGLHIGNLNPRSIMKIVRTASEKLLNNQEDVFFELDTDPQSPWSSRLEIAASRTEKELKIYILRHDLFPEKIKAKREMLFKNLPPQQRLGKGSWGMVSKVFSATQGVYVSLKEARPKKGAVQDLEAEYKILTALNPHGNCPGIQFAPHCMISIDSCQSGQVTKGFVGEEYEGSYDSIFKTERSIADKLDECHQLLSGLRILHQQGFIHGDLKPKNILTKVKNGRRLVHIADFGGARNTLDLKKDRIMVHCASTTPLKEWMALERTDKRLEKLRCSNIQDSIIQANIVSCREAINRAERQLDVFAMGSILFKALTGVYPYRCLPHPDFRQPTHQAFPAEVPIEIQEIIKSMVDPNQERRPTAEVAFNNLNRLLPLSRAARSQST